ncbi:MAG: hypothetical protein JWP08_3168 [Bryobacterales bacterium]|jgi:hypothetical protein|nr:hypothetical protein [Bryobacterales bacterium]
MSIEGEVLADLQLNVVQCKGLEARQLDVDAVAANGQSSQRIDA